ncbi:AAA family ATPase [uncultured Aureimonas sp.]|uniref:AAA family ATPase n=1 Tax=uncultured Aureimonas sp. TaxID=1604662 RepID=UPI0025FB1BB3|nr:AAA family ATPase [uncultured Aureimonas sp.]
MKNVAMFAGLISKVVERKPHLPGLACWYGPSGYGKTKAAIYGASRYRATYVECGQLTTARSLLISILKELGVQKPRGTATDMVDEAVEILAADRKRPLIIDEAHHIAHKAFIDVVRELHDKSLAPIVLIGEETLPKRLEAYERVHNRILEWAGAIPCDAEDNLGDVNAQLEFVWKELNTTEGKAFKRLLAAKDYFEANEAMISFERPSGYQNGVKNAHNYSGRLAFTKEAYERYGGGGEQVASSTHDAKVVAKGVTEGMSDYTRREESRGASPFGARSEGNAGKSAPGAGLFSERAMKGFEVLGAGLGAFSSGYQSGSPLSGGISGAFGGYQAGGAISSFLGIGAGAGAALGVVGGAALGILGGILGARKQREQAHRDKAAKWEELRPQYEAFDKSLSGDGNGQLRQWITEQEGAFAQFRKVGGDAWKYGQGNSSEQFASTGTKMWTRFMEMQAEFREGFTDMVEDLTSGEGLGGAFAKGRAATKDLKKQIRDMIDDVSIAFGSDNIGVGVNGAWIEASKAMEERRNAAIAEAKKAAGEYALSLLYTAATSSDVEKSLNGFRGTAAGLQKVLTDLGWTAEQAAADIDARLTQAIAKMGETFTDGYQREINDLSGTGYLNDIKDLFTARDGGLKDAKLLGVDPSIVSKWFALAVQDVVDGAELTGSAFDDLIKAFPELQGVVKAFTEGARTAAEVAADAKAAALSSFEASKSQLQDVYQTIRSYRDGIRSFLSGMKLDQDSSLSQKDRVAEARKVFEETLAKAQGGDKEAMGALTGAAQDYRDLAKAYLASSDGFAEVEKRIAGAMEKADVKATSQLDLMKSQASWLEDISANTADTAKAIADYLKSFQGVNDNRNWGDAGFQDRNKAIVSELGKMGIAYTGDFGGGKFSNYIASQTPALQAQLRALTDRMDRQFQLNLYDPKNKGVAGYKGLRLGGVVGAYQEGGIVGNGIFDQDSVLARYAGGGTIALAGGEGVITARAMTPEVKATVAYVNRHHALPEIGRQPAMAFAPANDAALARELRAAQAETAALMRQLIALTGTKADQTLAAIERGNRAAEGSAADVRRARSLSSTRTAA